MNYFKITLLGNLSPLYTGINQFLLKRQLLILLACCFSKTAMDNIDLNSLPNDSFVEYAIAVVPSYEGINKITTLNEKLAEQWIPQGLERKHNMCHVTLYHGAYDPHDLPKISTKLASIIAKIDKLTLHFSNIGLIKNRWVDLGIKTPDKSPNIEENTSLDYEKLCNLHSEVVDTFYNYHKRPLVRQIETLQKLQSQTKEDPDRINIINQIQTYGVAGVKDYFRPHVTLWYQWPENSAISKALEILKNDFEPFNCQGRAVVLAKLGFNGNIEGEVLDDSGTAHPYAVFPLGEKFTPDQARELALNTSLNW